MKFLKDKIKQVFLCKYFIKDTIGDAKSHQYKIYNETIIRIIILL